MSEFWDKAEKCEHTNFTDYYYGTGCGCSDFCIGFEERCSDCKVYIYECNCGTTGMSGWSYQRWLAYDRKTND